MHTHTQLELATKFLSRLHMCLGNEIQKKMKKRVKIVDLAMPASMSHCFVILFSTQTRFRKVLCTEKPVNVSKTVPYLWWKSCRSTKKKTHKYQRPANFGTVGLSLTISIYWNCNLLLFINFFTHFSLAFRDFSDVLYYKKDWWLPLGGNEDYGECALAFEWIIQGGNIYKSLVSNHY